MSKREPKKFLAPIVIAGITAGLFISAYKFVFVKSKAEPQERSQEYQGNLSENSDEK
ncbi:hypothetical protein LZZ98_00145 [Acinetobacter sp. SM34]|uniref:hypothetical protein n=1 Tax=Acinetobacter sp. SM34 TaxID=1301620 RepID=UPI001ED9EFC8|nr:hypothetical protein [Acinetobacter sp. SM34]MCG2606986.1 hypothetical protein [Acinetobacter sp. SM34]